MQYKKELVIKQALFVSFQIDSPDTDNVIHEFRWGFRAEQELNKEDVLEVISQVRALDLNFTPQIIVKPIQA